MTDYRYLRSTCEVSTRLGRFTRAEIEAAASVASGRSTHELLDVREGKGTTRVLVTRYTAKGANGKENAKFGAQVARTLGVPRELQHVSAGDATIEALCFVTKEWLPSSEVKLYWPSAGAQPDDSIQLCLECVEHLRHAPGSAGRRAMIGVTP